jgi:competence protein ComEC
MPLLWLSLAFLAGIALAASLPLSAGGWLILVGLAGLALFLRGVVRQRTRDRAGSIPEEESTQPQQPASFSRRLAAAVRRLHLPVPVFGLLLALALGGWRYQMAQPRLDDPGHIAYYNDSQPVYQIEGVLLAPPEVRETRLDLRLSAESLRSLDEDAPVAVRGDLLATTWDWQDWRYGDRLLLQGKLETPPEGEEFSYRQYLRRQGIFTIMQPEEIELLKRNQGNPLLAGLFAFKKRALDTLYQIYPDPEASLLAGILLGVESGIPEEVERAFQDSGTAHIVAISGFNIAILAGLFAALFSRLLGRWRGAVVALACIAVYTVLVGAGASVVRAALMGGLTLLAAQIGRRQAGLNSLALVAALMALFNPYVLWDVGFQLSFMATLGLVLYAGLLTGVFVRLAGRRFPLETAQKLGRPVGEYLLFTLAATLSTLPVIAYHFQRLSLVSLLANPFILPAQPPLMVLGGISLGLGMLYQPLGQALAWLSWPFAAYSIRLAELFADLPGSSVGLGRVSLGWVGSILCYLA